MRIEQDRINLIITKNSILIEDKRFRFSFKTRRRTDCIIINNIKKKNASTDEKDYFFN